MLVAGGPPEIVSVSATLLSRLTAPPNRYCHYRNANQIEEDDIDGGTAIVNHPSEERDRIDRHDDQEADDAVIFHWFNAPDIA